MQNRNKANYLKWKREWYLKHREAELLRKKKYQYTKNGIKSRRKSVDKYRKKYPEKSRVRRLFYSKVRSGEIERLPCEICGIHKSDGHHPDYSKPFVVIWLCRKHHASIHRNTKKIEDGNYRW